MDGDEQKLEPSKLKKDPIEILDNLKKERNNTLKLTNMTSNKP
jgi:hypothetical protein